MDRLRSRGVVSPSPADLVREAGVSATFAAKYLQLLQRQGLDKFARTFNPEGTPVPAPAPDWRDDTPHYTPTPRPEVDPGLPEVATPPEAPAKGETLAAILTGLRTPQGDDAAAVDRSFVRREMAATLERAKGLLGGPGDGGGRGPITIVLPDRPEVKLPEGTLTHGAYARALAIARATGLLCLYGPTGAGKTEMASQIAMGLGLAFSSNSCTAGMPESHLVGRSGVFPRDLQVRPAEDGAGWAVSYGRGGDWVPVEFVRRYEEGGLHLLDEWDAADANVRLIINSAIANGHMSIPGRPEAPRADRHATFVCAIGVNTLDGPDGGFVGRDPMDLASKDRFAMSKVDVAYDTQLERDLLAGFEGSPLGELPRAKAVRPLRVNITSGQSLGKVLYGIRDAIAHHKIDNQAMSTRSLMGAAKLRAVGLDDADVLGIYFTGWGAGDRAKVLSHVGLEVAQ